MSEGTFRAVVASVLVGALALAIVVAGAALLAGSPSPSPSASVADGLTPGPTPSSAPTPLPASTPTPTPTPIPAPAFDPVEVIGVGQIPRGGDSGETLVLRFVESSVDAIPDSAGSVRVTLTDNAGDGTTVSFTGTPSVDAPGSLGATASLVSPNVLLVSVVASDILNVEPITIRGLGIRVSTTAALGALRAQPGDYSGSLATGATSDALGSPGTVVAGP